MRELLNLNGGSFCCLFECRVVSVARRGMERFRGFYVVVDIIADVVVVDIIADVVADIVV